MNWAQIRAGIDFFEKNYKAIDQNGLNTYIEWRALDDLNKRLLRIEKKIGITND